MYSVFVCILFTTISAQSGGSNLGSQKHRDMKIGSQKHGGMKIGSQKHGGVVTGSRKHSSVVTGSRKHSRMITGKQKHGGMVTGSQKHSGMVTGKQKYGGMEMHGGWENGTKKGPAEVPFDQAGLAQHNKFRAIHGSKPMTIDPQMSAQAAAYAKKLLGMGSLQHANIDEGENLAMACDSRGTLMTAEKATTNWYKEVCKPGYSFGVESVQSGAGHFSQVVWDASTKLGMGRATGKKGSMTCTYVVGRYKEAGNFARRYNKNVMKGTFTTAMCADL